jgi:hypothetical protein
MSERLMDVELKLSLDIYYDDSQKVKLPREVSEAIERFRDIRPDDDFNSFIVETAMLGGISPTAHVIKDFACKTIGGFNTLVCSLVNGYEIDDSPVTKEG